VLYQDCIVVAVHCYRIWCAVPWVWCAFVLRFAAYAARHEVRFDVSVVLLLLLLLLLMLMLALLS